MKRILANNNKKSPVNINEIELEVEVNNKNKKNLNSECVPNDSDNYHEMDKNKGAAKYLVRKGLDKIKKSYDDNEAAIKKGALSTKKEFDNTGKFKGDVTNGVPFEKTKEGEKSWVGKGIDRIKKAHKKKPYQDRILEGAKKYLVDPAVDSAKRDWKNMQEAHKEAQEMLKEKRDKKNQNKK
jgi:hypothetical protein